MTNLLSSAPPSVLLSIAALLCFLGALVTHLSRFPSRFPILRVQRLIWLTAGIAFTILGVLLYVVGN